jgi:ABC-type transporter Mla subunit MlaD
MAEIPTWWLAISALFFIVNVAVLVILAVIGYRMMQTLQTLKPKLDQITKNVNDLVVTANSTAVKVDSIASNLKATSETVNTKASSALGAFEQASMVGAPLLGRVVPFVNIALVALRVFRSFREGRGSSVGKKK